MKTSKWALLVYIAIILFGVLAAVPNVLTSEQQAKFGSYLPANPVTLGLDLKGGSHLVLEVDAAALRKARMDVLLNDTRAILRTAGERASAARLSGTTLTITLPDQATLDKILPEVRKLATPTTTLGFTAGSADIDVATSGNLINVTLTEAGINERMSAAVEQSLEIIRRRVDQVGVAEPLIQRVGGDRILVQLPGLQDPTRLRQLLGSTAQMSFHMVDQTVDPNSVAPRGVMILPGANDPGKYAVEERVAISGDRLADAKAGFDQRTNEPIVSFSFDSTGARQFAEITQANVGKPFAIVLDGKVLTAPVIREPIIGGQGQISGNFNPQEATVLSALLRSGALPAPLTIIEERTVGPNLGSDSIRMGLYTGLAGLAAVVVLMQVLYGSWGLIANLGLVLHTVLTIGLLGLLGSTLTLPGIAGIILGIGMAVDANILINARIREETAAGAGAMKALDVGFNKAYATIVDGNMTTMVGMILLFMFGSGPVRGFAITMIIGLAISMFTSITFVRLLMREVVIRRKMKRIDIHSIFGAVPGDPELLLHARPLYRDCHVGLHLDRARSSCSSRRASTTASTSSAASRSKRRPRRRSTLPSLREKMEGLNLGEVALQEFGQGTSVLVRVQRQPGGEEVQTAALQQIRDGVAAVIAGRQLRAHGSGRPDGQHGACAVRLPRRRARHAGNPDLYLVALRMAFCRGRHCDADPGHHQDDRLLLADADRLQPDGHRRGADADRLFGQRQGSGVRPHAREHAQVQVDAVLRPHRPLDQPGGHAMHLHLGCRGSLAAADGDLGWRYGKTVRLADAIRRRRRDDLVDLYRRPDPAVPQPLVAGSRRRAGARCGNDAGNRSLKPKRAPLRRPYCIIRR
jgi:SecD/SecF fusion protein